MGHEELRPLHCFSLAGAEDKARPRRLEPAHLGTTADEPTEALAHVGTIADKLTEALAL